MEKALHVIDRMSHWTGNIFCYLIPVLMVVTLWEVISRYAFNNPTDWANEMTMFLCGGGGMLAGAYAFLYNVHAKVDVFYAKFSNRGRAIIDLATSLVFILPFVAVLLWLGWGRAWDAVRIMEGTDTPWNPVLWPARMTIPIGAFFLILQALAKFTRDIRTLATVRTKGENNA